MDLNLTLEQQQFRDELRAWLQANVPPPWSGSKAEEEKGPYFDYLRNWQRKASDGGWAAISWPKEYGGLDAKLIEMAILQEEWARADAPPWWRGRNEQPWQGRAAALAGLEVWPCWGRPSYK